MRNEIIQILQYLRSPNLEQEVKIKFLDKIKELFDIVVHYIFVHNFILYYSFAQ